MSSPKDITDSLGSWNPEPGSSNGPSLASRPVPERRLRSDLFGGFIYSLLVGVLFSQVLFLITFDLIL
ncbi:hypothetical protein [Rubellicoccus peritrichatus]|uniref:Uncharacterized protein n=1 Tax=Rubellicoccus peritrichatus TaxID=3080537 RepID=A0AAQ3LHQ5_9BACT|nr:hypothetical protein [Puniceicoccus sp. CR14]WOO42274.1 hypothetical protein RZN69_04175 [Puniceicoccus sp. CR14]